MPSPAPRILSSVLAALLVAGALAGCSSDGADAPQPDAAETPSVQDIVDGPSPLEGLGDGSDTSGTVPDAWPAELGAVDGTLAYANVATNGNTVVTIGWKETTPEDVSAFIDNAVALGYTRLSGEESFDKNETLVRENESVAIVYSGRAVLATYVTD